jgi:hypothetical protein
MGKENEEFAGTILKPEPVVAVTITCNLGGERQMSLAAHFERDMPAEQQNEILDRVMKVADRQKARYDLDKEEENFKIVGLNTRNAILAISAGEATANSQIERLKIELAAKIEAREEVFKAAYDAHATSGRRGTFEPKGVILQKLNLADSEIGKTRAALEAAPADAAQHRAQLVGSIQRNQEDMRIRRKRINELRGIAGLPPNDDFIDAEMTQV